MLYSFIMFTLHALTCKEVAWRSNKTTTTQTLFFYSTRIFGIVGIQFRYVCKYMIMMNVFLVD